MLALGAADACLSGPVASTGPLAGTTRSHPSGRLMTDAAMLVPNVGLNEGGSEELF